MLYCVRQVPPHFAQPNSAEFRPAVEWRQLGLVMSSAKKSMHTEHAQELEQLMRLYVRVQMGRTGVLCPGVLPVLCILAWW